MGLKGIISAEVKGDLQAAAALSRAVFARRKAAVDQLNLGAFAIHAASIADMNGPKSGTISNKGVGTHQASSAGESPARDTGELVRKLRVVLANENDPGPVARVISAAEYAAALEFGTERMAARPYLRPAFKANIKQIKANIKTAIKGGKS